MNLILTVVLTTAVWVCQPKVKLDDSALARVVGQSQNRAAIKACYQRTLRRDPELKLKAIATLDIDRSGKVMRVGFDKAVRDEVELTQCLSRSMNGWTFPAANSDYQFQFPIVLSAH
jgi:hypothetical protein